MKHLLGITLLAGLLVACSPQKTITPPETTADNAGSQVQQEALSESKRLNQWFEVKYEEQLQFSPLMMTFLGRKDKYDQFDDLSEAAEEKKFLWYEKTIDELSTQFDYDQLDEDAKISYDLWVYDYEKQKLQRPFGRRTYVFTQMQGLHAFLPNFLINFHKVDSTEDMQAYIKRISGIARGIDQLLVRTKLNAEEGVRAPYFAYEGVIEQSKNLLNGQPFDSESQVDAPLFADAKRKIDALVQAEKIDAAQAEAYTQEVKQALLDSFEPVYNALIAWFEADFNNVDKVAKGVGALPEGKAFYNAALFGHTTTQLTSDEIHAIGLKEVERLRGDMLAIMQQVKFKGSLTEFFTYLTADKQNPLFFYPDTDEGRQAYIDDAEGFLGSIDQKLPEYFGLLPKADLVVKRVEQFREQPGAAQHYYPGTPDGSRPGIYYAHLSDMTAMPKNEMEAIAYHEGNPGHHMQISIAQELEGVPTFRTQASFTSYVEGWALYSEFLAKEMGGYQSPYSDFGRLVTEIWRAIRLVVDTGIHAEGWTEQQAIDYFKANAPLSDTAVRSEVRRYFVLPGQATAYKIGMLKILELRGKAEQVLGDKFDIRGFHDTVLGGGAVPLNVLERRVMSWVDKVKAA